MRSLLRLLICVLVVSSPAQSWAAPMLCQSDMDTSSIALGHAHDADHAHHADTHHDSTMHHPSPIHDEPAGECGSECECSDCVVTVVLNNKENSATAAFGGERATLRDSHHSLYLDNIFRPPISS